MGVALLLTCSHTITWKLGCTQIPRKKLTTLCGLNPETASIKHQKESTNLRNGVAGNHPGESRRLDLVSFRFGTKVTPARSLGHPVTAAKAGHWAKPAGPGRRKRLAPGLG